MSQFTIRLLGFGGNLEQYGIPINGEQFKLERNGNIERVDILGLGESLLRKDPHLQSFSWESFWPIDPKEVEVITGVTGYAGNPNDLSFEIKEAIRDKTIGTMVCYKSEHNTAPQPYLYETVTIEDYTTLDKGGTVGDIWYSIKLSEAKEPKITQTAVTSIEVRQITPQSTDTGTQKPQEQVVAYTDDKQKIKQEQPYGPERPDFLVGDKVQVTGYRLYKKSLTGFFKDWAEKDDYKFVLQPGTIKSCKGKQDIIKTNSKIVTEEIFEIDFGKGGVSIPSEKTTSQALAALKNLATAWDSDRWRTMRNVLTNNLFYKETFRAGALKNNSYKKG